MNVTPDIGVLAWADDTSGVTGGRFYSDSTQVQALWRPGTSTETGMTAFSNQVVLRGQMSAQQSSTQTFVVKSISTTAGGSSLGAAFDITYPSRPYGMLGFGMGATDGQGRFTSISASAYVAIRDNTTSTAFLDALFVRAL